MEVYESFGKLGDITQGLDRAFEQLFREENSIFFHGICNKSLQEFDDYFYMQDDDTLAYGDYTEHNIFYIYIVYLTLKYNNKYILSFFYTNAKKAINELTINPEKFELTKEEIIELRSIAEQVKEGLPKLKTFESSSYLIDLETKEFHESRNKKE